MAQDLLSHSGLRLLGKSFVRLRPQLISSKLNIGNNVFGQGGFNNLCWNTEKT